MTEERPIAPERYPFLNTYVNALTMEQTINFAEEMIRRRIPTQHVVINALKVNLMQEDLELRKIVNSCPLINADGMSTVWGARFLGIPVRERVAGVDLFVKLVERAAQTGYKIYLFGAKEEVVKKTKKVLEERYPGVQIVGYRNGYFTEEDEPGIVDDMARSGADIMFVGFSSPKKEYWIYRNLSKLNIPFVMGVGGCFDWLAGKTKRPPVWVEKCGLAWFFRLIQEPRRMWRRYLIGNPKYVVLVLKEKLRMMRGKK